jgi:hypothetical protein
MGFTWKYLKCGKAVYGGNSEDLEEWYQSRSGNYICVFRQANGSLRVATESKEDLDPYFPYLKSNGEQWYKIEGDLKLTACEPPIEEATFKEYIPNIIIVIFLVGLLVTLSEWCI